MVDVFISYSRTNQAQVAQLADALAKAGYSVWWDAELPPHRSYGDVITEQIAEAKAAIVVWSESASASEWVRAEADLARNRKKLIQASLDDCMPPMPFNQIQFAYIGDWEGEPDHPGWRKIQASLADLCGGDAPREPAYALPASPPPASPPSAAPRSRAVAPLRPWLIPALAGAALMSAGASAYLFWDDTKEHAALKAVESDPAPRPRFNLAAMIDDPDGFTNVRAEPSPTGRIIDRVEEGEAFTTFAQTGDWWQVRTADDNVGWMSRSRIRLLDKTESAAAARAETEPEFAPTRTAAPPPVVEAPAAPPAWGMVIPDSSVRRLTEADLAGLSREQLAIARNEIFARHGRRFVRPHLRAHFEGQPWYRPVDGPVMLNPVEKANAELIARVERSR